MNSDEINLLAVLTLLFGYIIAGVLLADGKQIVASWLAIIGGTAAAVIEIFAILRSIEQD